MVGPVVVPSLGLRNSTEAAGTAVVEVAVEGVADVVGAAVELAVDAAAKMATPCGRRADGAVPWDVASRPGVKPAL